MIDVQCLEHLKSYKSNNGTIKALVTDVWPYYAIPSLRWMYVLAQRLWGNVLRGRWVNLRVHLRRKLDAKETVELSPLIFRTGDILLHTHPQIVYYNADTFL